jgi:hypothetical protein
VLLSTGPGSSAVRTLRAIDDARLQDRVREVGMRVTALLRTVADGERPVARLDWTVADLGAHLVTVARRNVRIASGEPMDWAPGDDPHASLAVYNDGEIAALGLRAPDALAELLLEGNEEVVSVYGRDLDRIVEWPQYRARARDSLRVWFGELLVHGLDLARTLDEPWPIAPADAFEVFDGLVPALTAFSNRAGASRASGRYHMRVRGGGSYTIDVSGSGEVSVTRGRPDRADLHVSADPVAYLLVGYGRASRWPAIARGAIVAWGRKPWLALRFAGVFARP